MNIPKDNFMKKLMLLVIPIALQNMLASLVSVSDTFMLGRLDQDMLSAISLATQVQFVISLFFSSLTAGTTILASQYWGKGDKDTVEKLLGLSMRITVLISLVFFVAASCFPEALMRLFTNESSLLPYGANYLRIVSISYLFQAIIQIYLCIMKNSDRVFRSTLYSILAVVLNIGLNAVFIFGLCGMPRLEYKGAAIATVLAFGIELLLVICEDLKTDSVKLRAKYLLHTDQKLKKDFFKYTTPVLIDMLIWGIGSTMISVIMGHLGTDAVAANGIANTAKNLFACFCLGLGGGAGILIGNELGQEHFDMSKKHGTKLAIFSVIVGICSGILVVLCTPIFVSLSTSLSQTSVTYLKWMLVICAWNLSGKSVNVTVMDGIFGAGGDTKFVLKLDIIVVWCLIIPLGAACAFLFKLPVLMVYAVLSFEELIKAPTALFHYRKYKWVKNLTK